MKTYDQAIHKAVLIALSYHFSGAHFLTNFSSIGNMISHIYDKTYDEVFRDFIRVFDEVLHMDLSMHEKIYLVQRRT